MKEIENKNLENQKKKDEALYFVFERLIYNQKIPFVYTFLTGYGITYGLILPLILGIITNHFVGGGVTTWSGFYILPVMLYIYKKKINISYVNRYNQIYLLNLYERVMKSIKTRMREKRHFVFLFLLCSFYFNPVASYASLEDSTKEFVDNNNEFMKNIKDSENKEKYSKKFKELNIINTSTINIMPINQINDTIRVQTELISVEKSE
jgi:uncharacterized membrane protein required for colicin V production